MLFPLTCLEVGAGWAGVRFFRIKGVQGQECEAPGAPPARPVHNAAFHAGADAAVCQPSGAAEPSLPTRRGPQWSLVLPSPLPEPCCLGEPPPTAPGAWLRSVTNTYMPVYAFCPVADSWQVMSGWEPLYYHNFPGERALFLSRCQPCLLPSPHPSYTPLPYEPVIYSAFPHAPNTPLSS